MNNFPCRCGHIESFHSGKFRDKHMGYILHCAGPIDSDTSGATYPCSCFKFKLDNLKYLEQLYEDKVSFALG